MSLQRSPTATRVGRPRKVSLDLDPYASPAEYYGKSHAGRKVAKSRTYSAVSHSCPARSYDETSYLCANIILAKRLISAPSTTPSKIRVLPIVLQAGVTVKVRCHVLTNEPHTDFALQ